MIVSADANTIDVADVVTSSEFGNLPLNSRNPYSLIVLTCGFAGSVGNNYNSISYPNNGSRQDYTDVLVDGIPGGFPTVNGNSGVGISPSVDAINQFRVLEQNYPAEFGSSLGGILNTAFKSGTTCYHGTLFQFARESALDANEYFEAEQRATAGLPTQPVRRRSRWARVRRIMRGYCRRGWSPRTSRSSRNPRVPRDGHSTPWGTV